MHPLLKRQLATLALDPERPPGAADWARFLERVSRSLEETEQRSRALEQSLAVAAREAAEHSLRAGADRDRMQAIIRSLGLGLCVLDDGGIVRSVNPEGERLLGRTEAELLGVDLTEIFSVPGRPDQQLAWRRAIRRRIGAGYAFREDNVCFATFYGRTIPVSLAVNPILKGGSVAGAVVVFSDETARPLAQAAR